MVMANSKRAKQEYECEHFDRVEKPALPKWGDDCPNCAKMATACPFMQGAGRHAKRDDKGRFVSAARGEWC